MKLSFNEVTKTLTPITAEGTTTYDLNEIHKGWKLGRNYLPSEWRGKEREAFELTANLRVEKKARGYRTLATQPAVYAYAMWVSVDFYMAVVSAFTELTKGNLYKAAAIAESVAIPPELIAKYDTTRETMVALILELEDAGKIKLGGRGVSTFSRLACKAATDFTPAELTGKNGSAKDYIVAAKHPEGLTAMIAAMQSIIRGLRMGLDYHQIAALLNVETTKNGDMLDYAIAA